MKLQAQAKELQWIKKTILNNIDKTAYIYIVANDTIRNFVNGNLDTFYKVLYNMIFFGKCLMHIDKSTEYRISIIPPHKYYVLDGEFIFLNDEEYNTEELIYLGEELFDVSMLALSVAKLSMVKEHNDSLWYNNNKYLNGYVHTLIKPEVIPHLGENETINTVGDKMVQDIVALPENGGVLNTFEGIEAMHKDIVNTGVGTSYLQYIEKKEQSIENLILGRSTQANDTTYASEKIRFLNTTDIQFADVLQIQRVINTVLKREKWDFGIQHDIEFKINVAVDEDELKLITVLNGLKNLDIKDELGEPPTFETEYLRKSIGMPLLNKGKVFKLEKPQQTQMWNNYG